MESELCGGGSTLACCANNCSRVARARSCAYLSRRRDQHKISIISSGSRTRQLRGCCVSGQMRRQPARPIASTLETLNCSNLLSKQDYFRSDLIYKIKITSLVPPIIYDLKLWANFIFHDFINTKPFISLEDFSDIFLIKWWPLFIWFYASWNKFDGLWWQNSHLSANTDVFQLPSRSIGLLVNFLCSFNPISAPLCASHSDRFCFFPRTSKKVLRRKIWATFNIYC